MKIFEGNDVISLDSENSVGQYLLQPIGYVRSTLKRLEDCQKQNWEGAIQGPCTGGAGRHTCY
jgi:hypothetical protein